MSIYWEKIGRVKKMNIALIKSQPRIGQLYKNNRKIEFNFSPKDSLPKSEMRKCVTFSFCA